MGGGGGGPKRGSVSIQVFHSICSSCVCYGFGVVHGLPLRSEWLRKNLCGQTRSLSGVLCVMFHSSYRTEFGRVVRVGGKGLKEVGGGGGGGGGSRVRKYEVTNSIFKRTHFLQFTVTTQRNRHRQKYTETEKTTDTGRVKQTSRTQPDSQI